MKINFEVYKTSNHHIQNQSSKTAFIAAFEPDFTIPVDKITNSKKTIENGKWKMRNHENCGMFTTEDTEDTEVKTRKC